MRVPQRGGGSRCTRGRLGADAEAGRLKRSEAAAVEADEVAADEKVKKVTIEDR